MVDSSERHKLFQALAQALPLPANINKLSSLTQIWSFDYDEVGSAATAEKILFLILKDKASNDSSLFEKVKNFFCCRKVQRARKRDLKFSEKAEQLFDKKVVQKFENALRKL